MVVRRRLLLPEGYSATQVDAVWHLADPHGALVFSSEDATTVEIHAWRHVWRKRHENFTSELAAFRAGARLPEICGRYGSPETPRAAANARAAPRTRPVRLRSIPWRAIAVAAAGTAAGLVVGLAGMGPLRESVAPLPSLNQRSASVPPAPKARAAGFEPAGVPEVARVVVARPRPKARYAVSVGNYTSPAAADRMKHLVRSKGYVVDVVQQGAVSQVVTAPFRTREQAEGVARGFEEIRLPAHLVAERAM